MKISLEWLGDYVSLPSHVPVSQIMHDLTLSTVEVEAAEDFSYWRNAEFINVDVVVARVESIQPAGRGTAARVTIGDGRVIDAVAGAANLTVGMRTAVALTPSADGTTAARVCAVAELQLGDLFPDLSADAALDLDALPCSPGDRLVDVIGWRDTVLEIDNKSLTNRPDLWSHYGIARELAAIYRCPLKPLPQRENLGPDSELIASIDPAGCRRLSLLRLTNVRTEQSPFWMRSRLARVGQRPINFWVDVTNYVMFAVGQPCHAYDCEHLNMPLVVRYASDGEPIDLLNGNRYTLDARTLIIADQTEPVDLAGVMGGGGSAISGTTKEILFEAGNFDALSVRKASARLGLRTEASARFEKGLDTQRVDDGLALFSHLVKAIQPDAQFSGFQDLIVAATTPQRVRVGVPYIQKRLGAALPAEEIASQLSALQFQVTADGTGTLTIEAPSWRSTGDISGPHDIIEEVARLRGYDSFEFVALTTQLSERAITPRLTVERRLVDLLTLSGGMQEVVTYPWCHDTFLDATGSKALPRLRLAVPVEPERSSLRPSLLPNLLEVVASNVAHHSRFRVFEVGRVFLDEPVPGDDPRETLKAQPHYVAGAFVGEDGVTLFRQAKGLLEQIERTAGVHPLRFVKDTHAAWADSSARLTIASGDTTIGTLGILTKRAQRIARIKRGTVVMFELDIDRLVPRAARESYYTPLAPHRDVDFDISLVFRDAVSWDEIRDTVRPSHPLIRDVAFVDEYRGSGVGKGFKSITLRLWIGVGDRSLTSEEINAVGSQAADTLKRNFGAEQRMA